MPHHVVARLAGLLNEEGLPLKGTKVLALGVTYKRDCADTRESPAIDVMLLLRERGVELSFYDPYVEEFDLEGTKVPRVDYTPETVAAHDAVLILTDHTDVDHSLAIEHSKLVFDTRNATKLAGVTAENVTKL